MNKDIRPNKALGLTCGAFASWLSLLILYLINTTNIQSKTEFISFIELLFVVTFWYFSFGLPIAFLICFVFGGVAWYFCESLGLIKMWHALIGGAAIGAMIGGWLTVADHVSRTSEILLYIGTPSCIGIVTAFVTHHYGYKGRIPIPKP